MSDYDYSWCGADIDVCECCRIRRPVQDRLCKSCAEADRDTRRGDEEVKDADS